MPTLGERSKTFPDRVWDGNAWTLEKTSKKSESSYVPSSDAKPKVKSEGYSGVEETSKKSLSQILAEREEKRKKAAVVRDGGK